MLLTRVRFDNKTKEFVARNAVAIDAAMAFMAQDIEIIIKTGGLTPFRKGKLRGDTYHEKKGIGKYRVNVPVEYAAVQEKGYRTGAAPFRNYTTAGTGKGFFKNAVDKTLQKRESYLKKAKEVAGIQ